MQEGTMALKCTKCGKSMLRPLKTGICFTCRKGTTGGKGGGEAHAAAAAPVTSTTPLLTVYLGKLEALERLRARHAAEVEVVEKELAALEQEPLLRTKAQMLQDRLLAAKRTTKRGVRKK